MTIRDLVPDAESIAKFISEVTSDWSAASDQDDFFEIRCLGEGQAPVTRSFRLSAAGQAVEHAVRTNQNRLNVYMTINPIDCNSPIATGKSATDNDILRAHYNFADADDEQGLVGLKELAKSIDPDIIVTTGTIPYERQHNYWRLKEPCRDLELWRRMQVDIATQFGTDTTVINPSRIMRIAGSVTYPNVNKRARGYVPELVSMRVRAG
jgi:hypothetical protein